MSKKKILIIYANLGLGPKRISEPLEKKLISLEHQCVTLSLESVLPNLIKYYLFDLPKKYKQNLFGIYRNNINFNSNKFMYFLIVFRLMLILPFTIRRIKNKLQSINPDAIIATSFLSAYFAMYWRKFLSKEYKLYGVLVDYYPSPIWYIPIDKIFVANNLSKNILEQYGCKSTSIHVSGIPISLKNTHDIIPLNQRKQILLTGGGWGLGPILEITKILLSLKQISKINVICGDNLLLKNQLETLFKHDILNNRLQVIGFIPDIEKYYRHARIIISKAGGITLTEVPIFEIPMIITSIVTGSEEKNREYFSEAEACELATTPDEIIKKVLELLNNEDKCKKLIKNAKRLIYPDSSHTIVKTILEDLSDEN